MSEYETALHVKHEFKNTINSTCEHCTELNAPRFLHADLSA